MQIKFRGALFGYNKKQVNEFAQRVQQEHDEMAMLRDRFVDLRDEVKRLEGENAIYKSHEREISSSIITAHVTASDVIREGKQTAAEEEGRLMEEVRRLDRARQSIRAHIERALLDAMDSAHGFEKELNDLLQKDDAFLKRTFAFEEPPKERGEDWTIKV